jgi:hypothetical protein
MTTASSPDLTLRTQSETGLPGGWKRKVALGFVVGGGVVTIVWIGFLIFLAGRLIGFWF